MSNTQSIEFQDIKKEKAELDITRRSFRVPVDPDDDIKAVINKKIYSVIDISLEGISIACKDNKAFMVDQTFSDCELKIRDGGIKHLTGRIVHFSCGSGSGKNWINGIQWIAFDDTAQQKLSTLVGLMKDKLLKMDTASDGL